MSMMVLFVLSPLASAQEGAKVYLVPVDSTEGRLTVDIIAENVTEMYGAEVQLTYDPAVLSVQDTNPNQEGIQIEAGTLLPVDQGFVVANKVNETEGTIVFAMTLLNPAPSVNGSGPLARVTFNVLNNVPSTINVGKAKLVSIDLQTIPSQITPLAIGSVEQQNAPQQGTKPQNTAQQQQPVATTPSVVANTAVDAANGSDFPWWIVAAGIMVLGLLGLGALVIVSSLNKAQQTNQSQPKRPQQPQQPETRPQTTPERIDRQQQSGHVSGTRPSAFK